jgi:hypothetical protein
LAIKDVVEKISRDVPNLALNVFYMDDGSILGDMDDVFKAWNIIKDVGPQVGFNMNVEKCKLAWATGIVHPENPFGNSVESFPSSNFTLLGSPIGDAEFCDAFVVAKSVKKAKMLGALLAQLKDSQVAFLLLYFCLSFSRMNFFLRTHT